MSQAINSQNFAVTHRPRLAEITDHPQLDFADYERRLTSLQGALQRPQQAYLGTSERALLVLEGWDTAGKGASSAALVGPSIPAVSRSTRSPRRTSTSTLSTTFSASGAACRRRGKSLRSTGPGMAAFWWSASKASRPTRNGGAPIARSTSSSSCWSNSGIRLVKLFLHITPDEQVRRFRDRLIDPVKRWKLSYEDFRNHTRWSDYETAIEDMMEETATKHAPWHLIPANNKPYGRIVAFRIVADRLGKDMSLDPRPIDPDLLKEAKRVLNLSASDIERASHPAKRKVKLKRNHPEI